MSRRTAGPQLFPPLGPAKVSGGINPEGWDRLVLNGEVCPALATITRGGIKLKEDKKDKAGADGTRPTYHGIEPQALGVDLETYSDDDREALAGILAKLAPLPDRPPRPISIDHPSIRHLPISMVVLVEVGAFIPVRPGVAKVALGFSHWSPPKSNKSATVSPKVGTRDPANARAERDKARNPPPMQRPGAAGPPPGVK